MKYRILAAWYCLRGKPTIFNVHFSDAIKIWQQNRINIGNCTVNNKELDYDDVLIKRTASNVIPFKRKF